MPDRKKIIYITGSRSESNLMMKTLKELDKHFDLTIITCGQHTSETIQEIKDNGFNPIVIANITEATLKGMLFALAEEMHLLYQIIQQIKPKLVIVFGDRTEALAGALATYFSGIKLLHIGGGDLSGSVDNKVRFAITALADYHMTGCYESYQRLLKGDFPKQKIINSLKEVI